MSPDRGRVEHQLETYISYNNLEINTLHLIEWPEIIPCKIIKSNIDIYLDAINGQRLISVDIDD